MGHAWFAGRLAAGYAARALDTDAAHRTAVRMLENRRHHDEQGDLLPEGTLQQPVVVAAARGLRPGALDEADIVSARGYRGVLSWQAAGGRLLRGAAVPVPGVVPVGARTSDRRWR